MDDVRILKILKKVKKSPNDKDKWARYKKQRNYVTRIFRQAEADYWKYKFENANGSGEFWKIVREMKGQKKGNIGSIREKEGVILNDDKEKAEILNQCFAEIGQKLATNIQPDALFGEEQHFHRITPTISNFSIDKTVVSKCIEKRKKRHCDPLRSKKGHCDPLRIKKKPCDPLRSKKGHCDPLRSKKGHCHHLRSKKGQCDPLRSKKGHCDPLCSKKGIAIPYVAKKALQSLTWPKKALQSLT